MLPVTEGILDPSALTEERLRELAGDLALDEPGQLDFLLALHSLDVQAAPGSGKTTLAALKLCAIARGWLPSHQGVCVLSHTNVAKDQIRQRLEQDSYGRALLRPPHFIGTIQSFVDTFLALPYARGRGFPVRFIDDETYAAEALQRFDNWSRYSVLRAYLARRQNGRELVVSGTFVFDGGEMVIRPASADFPSGPTSKSHLQYLTLKKEMADDGYYRFLDMYAFARHLLSDHPDISPAVAARFRWIMIDEMQDTSAEQQHLIDALFRRDDVVVQRIGDENQRIFGDDADTGFPSNALELPVSRRFGSRISEVVSALTMRRPQQVVGRTGGGEGHRMVIVFNEASATEVLPRFAREAEQILPAGTREGPLVAVAARTGESQARGFPRTMHSYLGDKPPTLTTGRRSLAQTLVEVVRTAQTAASTGRQNEAVTLIWGGLAELADGLGVEAPTGRLTATKLRRLIRADQSSEQEARHLARHLLEEACTDSEAEWQQVVRRLSDWSLLKGQEPTARAAAYCTYVASEVATEVAAEVGADAEKSEAGGLRLGTIHSVKGETHSGTLLLECLDKTGKRYDVLEALKLITGQAAMGDLPDSAIAACQLAFVALSRPRSLLALAVLDEHVQPYLDDLVTADWVVVDVRHDGSQVSGNRATPATPRH